MSEAGGDLRINVRASNRWGPWKLGKKGVCKSFGQEFSCCLSSLRLVCLINELGMRRGRKPWLLGSPGGYQQSCLVAKSKAVAATALNHSAFFVLYNCILKFELWEGDDKTTSPSGASFLVYLILSVQTCYPVSS